MNLQTTNYKLDVKSFMKKITGDVIKVAFEETVLYSIDGSTFQCVVNI